jgi:SM-20-related protein
MFSRFIDRARCEEICEEALGSPAVTATVSRLTARAVVDERMRRNTRAEVSTTTRDEIDQRFRALLPALARHFRQDLDDVQQPQFLVYGPGDFFRPHTDTSSGSIVPPQVRARCVSVVLFLNRHSARPVPGTFGGGALRFIDDSHEAGPGELFGEEGLLVAFRSTLWHEVSPITRGHRLSVVSWYTRAITPDDLGEKGRRNTREISSSLRSGPAEASIDTRPSTPHLR